jgi:adenosylcobinamide-GDP ribazoletransferase
MRNALALLTILPTGRRPLPAMGSAGLLAFPVVGLLVGLAWAGAGAVGMVWWGPLVAAAAVVAVDAIVTGGLHLDGVADVGDVVGSRRRGPAALEVARDPSVGALGVVTLVGVLVLRFALVAAVLTGGGAWALVAVPVTGRAAMLHALRRCGAHQDSLAHPLAAAATAPVLATGLVAATVALILTGVGPWRIAAAGAAGVALVECGTWWWRCRIGPASGDLVGALGVSAELVTLLALTAG